MDLLQVHETQAEICDVIFISHGEQSLSLLLYFSFKPHCSALWHFLKLKWAMLAGFFSSKFLLTNPGDVLEHPVGVGPLTNDEPRNCLREASAVLTDEITGVS